VTEFAVVTSVPYDGAKGLVNEVPLLRFVLKRLLSIPRLGQWNRTRLCNRVFGHMRMYVASKPLAS